MALSQNVGPAIILIRAPNLECERPVNSAVNSTVSIAFLIEKYLYAQVET